MRAFWPDGYFEDADSLETHQLFGEWVSRYATSSTEFFVFRTAEAVAAWEESGAIPENSNTMLHFFTGEPPSDGSRTREVTIVCDVRSEEIQALITDLKRTFFPFLLRIAA